MERLNLNVPTETRQALKRLAAGAHLKEAELARELLVKAVEQAEREAFFLAMDQNMTAAARRRLGAMARALDKVRGRSR